MFTATERERVQRRLVEIAESDPRIVAGALVGSLAAGQGDEWSDIDVTFGVDERFAVAAIDGLLRESHDVRDVAERVEPQLRELLSIR